MSTKAQVWIMEFALALFLFIFGIAIFYTIYPQLTNNNEDLLNEIYLDAKTISESLITIGYPINWNETNVKQIGLLNEQKHISNEKVINFNELVKNNYNNARLIFGIRSDFLIIFLNQKNQIINISSISKIGKENIEITNYPQLINNSDNKLKNIAKIERIIFYEDELIKIIVLTWN
jgi:hypothetical protein